MTSIEQAVAQLFMVGSDTLPLGEEVSPFYETGVGGLILFRHHAQGFETAAEFRAWLAEERRKFGGLGLSLVGVDQEGGAVERLPHWIFPSGILPGTLGKQPDTLLAERINREMARRLKWLGFNVNFTPTVDLDRERLNPIIGPRAYASEPERVLAFATAISRVYLDSGILPVAKHFPGHGSGTVDSHLDLPCFEAWTQDELMPYQGLLRQNLLHGVMVAHGLYPKLAKDVGADPERPASLSPGIILSLLRGELGFDGLVFSDDLTMGAVWHDRDPVDVALEALDAGVDMLVYRRATPEALAVYEALVSRFKQGKLPEGWLMRKIERLQKIQEQLDKIPACDFDDHSSSPEANHSLALQWAQEARVTHHQELPSPLPLGRQTRWGLVAPDRKTMRHYAPDEAKGQDLLHWVAHYGLNPQWVYWNGIESTPRAAQGDVEAPVEVIVFVAFNAHLDDRQVACYDVMRRTHPDARVILVSVGAGRDAEVLSRPWIHVELGSYRPASLQSLIQWLISSPSSGF